MTPTMGLWVIAHTAGPLVKSTTVLRDIFDRQATIRSDPLEHAGVPPKAALPVLMADHCSPATREHFFRSESASNDRLDSEDAKELGIPTLQIRPYSAVAPSITG